MPYKDYRAETRKIWGGEQDGDALTTDQIYMGCMLRIADAVELMAKDHDHLIKTRDAAIKNENYWLEECERISRSNRALRGVITKLKDSFGVHRHTATRTYKKGKKP